MDRLAIITLFILLMGSSIKAQNNTKKTECTKAYKLQVDRLVIKILIFGETGRKFPENDQHLKPFCNETTQMIQSVEDYFKQCERRERQDLANIFIYSIKHILRTFCRKRKTKKVYKFFEVAPCLNKHIHEDTCIDEFSLNTKPLIVANIGNDKFKHICCNYVRAMECIDNWIMSHQCSRDYRELLNNYAHGIFDNLINFMCGENFADSDRCDHLKPLPHLSKKQEKQLKPYESFMFIMIDIMDSLSQSIN